MVKEGWLVINMKQYKIIKIVFAETFSQALLKEKKAEIVDISLNEDVQAPSGKIGFRK